MQTHDTALKATLQRLNAAGLHLNNGKCRFRQSSLLLLGPIVSVDGLLPNAAHIQEIVDAPAPTALGSSPTMLQWWNQCEHADTDNAFKWPENALASFEELNCLLVKSPALALFDRAL